VLAGAFVTGLAFVGARWAVPAGALAVLLAFARVYTGVHYPSDAVGGLLIGAAIGAVVVVLLHRVMYRLTRYVAGTPLRVAVSADSPDAARSAGTRSG